MHTAPKRQPWRSESAWAGAAVVIIWMLPSTATVARTHDIAVSDRGRELTGPQTYIRTTSWQGTHLDIHIREVTAWPDAGTVGCIPRLLPSRCTRHSPHSPNVRCQFTA